jgi:hypothetical protein
MNVWPGRFFRILAVAIVGGLLLLSLDISAAQDELSEIRSSVDYSYGQSMRFNLTARNVGLIDSVTLYFRLGTSPDSYAVEVPVDPGLEIETSYRLDLTQTRLPPFGAITYWWELEKEDGSTVRVPEQVVNYVDDQFNWRQLSEIDPLGGGTIRFFWTGEDEELGPRARELTSNYLLKLGRLLPLEQIVPFDVYIYPSSADLSAALRLAGRDYIPGQSYPDLGVILISVVNPQTAEVELQQQLANGLVNLLLYQAVEQQASRLPAWLVSGLSEFIRDEANLPRENALRLALANDETLPLAQLCSFESIEDDLAQAQSEAYVEFIVKAQGEEAIRKLIREFAEDPECSSVIVKALGMTPQELDAAWQRSVLQSNAPVATVTTIIWGGLVLAGFVLAALIMIRPKRR